ncbi:hypothetical protein Tco_1184083 [Tanacetum coccineum]
MYYPRFTKVIIHYFLTQDKILSWRNKIRMHTSKDDYLINTLRFVSAREETQIYGAILSESLTSPEIKETKAYKTYLSFASGKSKRVKIPANKSTYALARGVVIRETPEVPVSKKREKVDVARGKGIKLLFDVALKENAQFEEVRRKSIGDFHKTHLSGSSTATKPTPSAAIIKPSVTNEGTSVKPGVPNVTKEESSKSEAESWGNDEDDNNNDQDSESEGSDQEKDSDDDKTQSDKDEEIVKTSSNDSDDEDETKVADKAKGDVDEEMDYTTSLLYDDVDIRLNEPVDTDKGFKTELIHLTWQLILSTVIPQSFPPFIPPPQQSTFTPPPITEDTNPSSTLLDFASVFQFNNRVSTLEKEVAKLKKDDPLKTQVTALVDEHLDARLGATRDDFMNFLSGETPEVPVSKKKEKVDVARGKGIKLLFDVALKEDAQFEEFRRKRTGVKPGVPNVTKEESSKNKAESWGNDKDDNNNDQDSENEGSDQEKNSDDDKTQSDSEIKSDSEQETNESDETKVADKAEGDVDEEMGYTTSLLYYDVDIRLNEPVDTDKGFVQVEGTDAAMTNVQQGNKNPEILQVIEDAHVTLFTILQKTELIHLTCTKPVNTQTPHIFQFNNRVSTLEKEVAELKKDDPLKTQVTALVDEHLDARLGATKDDFMNFLSGSQNDKDEDSFAGSDQGLKKRKTSKDATPATEELEFEVADLDKPQDQEENLGNNDVEPKENVASKCDWFTKPSQPQEPTNPD